MMKLMKLKLVQLVQLMTMATQDELDRKFLDAAYEEAQQGLREGGLGDDRAQVDFDRLVRRDTLVRTPPQNLDSTLGVIGWADEHLGFTKRVFGL